MGWIATWTAAPQLTEPDNLPPPPFITGGTAITGGTTVADGTAISGGVAFGDCTLRQTLRVSAGGTRLRLRFSNAYGATDLAVSTVRVALPRGGHAGASAIEAGTSRAARFGGRGGFVAPPGSQVVSDPLDFPLPSGARVTVTVYLESGQQVAGGVTSHPGSRTTSHLRAGNHVDAGDLNAGDLNAGDLAAGDVAAADHWYFLSGAEVWTDSAGVAVILGDSLTDGRGSTTNGNDRWPDQFHDRLCPGTAVADRAVADHRGIAVVNQGIGGNRVLRDGVGPSVLARFDRDVLAVSGVRWLVVFEGINDIGTAGATAEAAGQVAADLVFGYEQLIARAHASGIAVYGATLTPLGGSESYDDPGGHHESARRAVNDWIRTSGWFDAVLDFDEAVRDQKCPRRLRAAFDTGDHLHLNPAGYAALAAAVPPALFLRNVSHLRDWDTGTG